MLGLMIGPLGPMTTIAYIPFILIATDPNPAALGSLEHITITVSMDGPNGTRIPGTTIHRMVIPPSAIAVKHGAYLQLSN